MFQACVVAATHPRADRKGKQMERGLRQRLTREANRLSRETFDRDVTSERLVIIRDRLAEIDAQIYGPRPGAHAASN